MIGLHETIVSLSQAAKLLPRRRQGKPVHPSCLFRWTKSGCRGVILESIQVGGTRCTSKEALERFFQQLAGDDPRPSVETVAAKNRRRQQQVSQAKATLDRAKL
jgi:hypothetical protein